MSCSSGLIFINYWVARENRDLERFEQVEQGLDGKERKLGEQRNAKEKCEGGAKVGWAGGKVGWGREEKVLSKTLKGGTASENGILG